MQKFVPELHTYAKVYTINRDSPAQAAQVRQISRTSLPILYDTNLEVARQFDFLPKPGQPMGRMSGIPQMGFVVIDAQGTIRAQRVDIYFGRHGNQILEIVKSL